MPETPIYKIIFFSMGQIYEVYARHIFQSDLYGFIEVEQLVFGERSQMLVDPSEAVSYTHLTLPTNREV